MIKNKRYIADVIVSVLLMMAVFSLLRSSLGIGKVDYVEMNNAVSAEVTYADGTVKPVDVNVAAGINAGDIVTFQVKLPNQSPYQTSELCFYQYHSIIQVYDADSHLLAEYGREEADDKRMLGNMYVHTAIPEDAWGKTLTIKATQVEGANSDHFTRFRILPADSVNLYPIIGKVADYYVFTGTELFSLVAGILLICGTVILKKDLRTEIWLSLFIFLLSAWHLGAERMFSVLNIDSQFAAVVEYAAVNALPIPMYFYLSHIVQQKKNRNYFRIIAAYFACLLAFTTCMNIFARIHYPSFEPVLFASLGISFIITLYIVVKEYRGKKHITLSTSAVLMGACLAIIPSVIKLAILFLRMLFPGSRMLADAFQFDYYVIAMTIFLLALVLSLCLRLVESIRIEAQRAQLKEMAYIDMLTGIHNRNYCVQELDKLDQNKQEKFAIVFMDADHLKKANDQYGHQTGDELIRTTAACIQKAFGEEDGFFGRWGGDEFIAVLKDPEKVDTFEARFEQEVEAVNQSGRFPFPFHISYGAALRNLQEETSSLNVCSQADEKMYACKKEHEKNEKTDTQKETK